MMNLCSDKHDEIVFNARFCPLCEALKTIDELTKDNQGLEEEIQKYSECGGVA